ncbi:hypothetical protein [Bradyrhizobium sp. LA6.7]
MSWSASFDDPISLPDGGELMTLLDAGNYIAALPPKVQSMADRPCWRESA